MSKPIPPRYKTTNWASYNAALKRRGSLMIWFDPEMAWEAALSGKRGGRQVYNDAAIQACLTVKVVFEMALRQTTGFVTSLLKLARLDWSVPDFSTLSRRQKDLAVVLPRRARTGPMHLLIDSTGIKVEGDGEWHARKHSPSKRRRWVKLHLAINAETLEVQAVEITGAGVGTGSIFHADPHRMLIPSTSAASDDAIRPSATCDRTSTRLSSRSLIITHPIPDQTRPDQERVSDIPTLRENDTSTLRLQFFNRESDL